ncbi:hypothetical protein [Klebsiella variicola]|uniref:hypothetical protein n=1 Tax=Klebsiella variicola TaxID=244366 RepID=UPI0034DEF071
MNDLLNFINWCKKQNKAKGKRCYIAHSAMIRKTNTSRNALFNLLNALVDAGEISYIPHPTCIEIVDEVFSATPLFDDSRDTSGNADSLANLQRYKASKKKRK